MHAEEPKMSGDREEKREQQPASFQITGNHLAVATRRTIWATTWLGPIWMSCSEPTGFGKGFELLDKTEPLWGQDRCERKVTVGHDAYACDMGRIG